MKTYSDFLNHSAALDKPDLSNMMKREFLKFYNPNPDIIAQQINDSHNFSGKFVTEVNHVKFSCIFIKNQTEFLYVLLNGAKEYQYDYITSPQIPRWSYYNVMNGSVLGIDDPMYNQYEKLKLGWYYGTEKYFYLNGVIEIVKDIIKKNHMPHENICFYSSSGGGFASMIASSMLKKTISISINPQIYLKNWWYAKYFTGITGIDLNKKDIFFRNDPTKLLKNSKSKHVIITNIASNQDFEEQLLPFARELGFKKLRLGLNHKHNILIWLYYADSYKSAHTAFETKGMFPIINDIAAAFKTNNNFDVNR